MPLILKKCVICSLEKTTTDFYKKKNGKHGVSSRCKPCNLAYNKKYLKAAMKRYNEKHKDRINAKKRESYAADPDKHKQQQRAYKLDNYEKILLASRKYEAENKEARLLKSRTYAKNNPHKVAAVNLKRRVKEKNATPIWADTEMTKKIYKLRDRLNNLAGYIKYHVDHVIPLNAKIASGLHVYNNLKIELATVNMSKRNTFEGIN